MLKKYPYSRSCGIAKSCLVTKATGCGRERQEIQITTLRTQMYSNMLFVFIYIHIILFNSMKKILTWFINQYPYSNHYSKYFEERNMFYDYSFFYEIKSVIIILN